MLASSEGPIADLEFIGGGDEENLEDRIRQLQQHDEETVSENEISLRLLRRYASSVRHQQFHGTDIITVRVGHSGDAVSSTAACPSRPVPVLRFPERFPAQATPAYTVHVSGPVGGCGHEHRFFPESAVRSLRRPGGRFSSRLRPRRDTHARRGTRTARPCPSPTTLDFTPGHLLGSVSGGLGLAGFLAERGHRFVVTSDKDGPDSVFERELPDADIVISQPFWPGLPDCRAHREGVLGSNWPITAGIGSDHVDLQVRHRQGHHGVRGDVVQQRQRR